MKDIKQKSIKDKIISSIIEYDISLIIITSIFLLALVISVAGLVLFQIFSDSDLSVLLSLHIIMLKLGAVTYSLLIILLVSCLYKYRP